jgi:transcription antitermination factor NusG
LLKLQDNPPITPVAPDGRSIFGDAVTTSAGWVALYTKPRQEKSLAADLLQLGVDYFLPLVRKVTMSGGRKRTALHPLFPSYLFADLGDEQRRLSALRTDRIVQVIAPEPSQQDGFIRELSAIEAAVLHCPERIELQPRVVDGARVRITGGAMKGIEGVVVKSDRRAKIWLQVTTLGTGVQVEIESDLLEPTE